MRQATHQQTLPKQKLMTAELFTLCDGAFNYNGRLTIIGTFDGIKAPQVPFRKSFSIATILRREEGAASQEKSLTISIKDEDGHEVTPPLTLDMSPSAGDKPKVVMALTLNNLLFKSYGTYFAELSVDDKVLLRHEFKVFQ